MKALHPHLAAKRHVIWDWNGTLLSDIDHAVSTTNRLLAESGLPPVSLERYKEIFRFPIVDYHRDLGLPTESEPFRKHCELFNQYFLEGVRACDLWPGARETLAYVKSQGKVQSLLSASEQGVLNEQMKIFRLEGLFDHIMGIADKMASSKVDRGLQLMRAAGVPAADTILIGDTDHDHDVAEALGIDLILVEHGHQNAARLRARHHTVLKVY